MLLAVYHLANAYYKAGEMDDCLLLLSALYVAAPLFHSHASARRHGSSSNASSDAVFGLGMSASLLRVRCLLASGRLLAALHCVSGLIMRVEKSVQRDLSALSTSSGGGSGGGGAGSGSGKGGSAAVAAAAAAAAADAPAGTRTSARPGSVSGVGAGVSAGAGAAAHARDVAEGNKPSKRLLSNSHLAVKLSAVAKLYYLHGKALQVPCSR